jgi:hypothetical protein
LDYPKKLHKSKRRIVRIRRKKNKPNKNGKLSKNSLLGFGLPQKAKYKVKGE